MSDNGETKEPEVVKAPELTEADLYRIIYLLVRHIGGPEHKIAIPLQVLASLPQDVQLGMGAKDGALLFEAPTPASKRKQIFVPQNRITMPN
jgi:hypothetical protein